MDQVVKPKRRWFQFGLKSLFVLPVVVGLALALYLYEEDWKKHRPPLRTYDYRQYKAAFGNFVEDLKADRIADAYESTSASFKRRMSLGQFDELIRRYPTVTSGPLLELDWYSERQSGIKSWEEVPLRNWSTHMRAGFKAPDCSHVELWAWVVMYDNYFHSRPPLPKVEAIEIRVETQWPYHPTDLPPLPPWERE